MKEGRSWGAGSFPGDGPRASRQGGEAGVQRRQGNCNSELPLEVAKKGQPADPCLHISDFHMLRHRGRRTPYIQRPPVGKTSWVGKPWSVQDSPEGCDDREHADGAKWTERSSHRKELTCCRRAHPHYVAPCPPSKGSGLWEEENHPSHLRGGRPSQSVCLLGESYFILTSHQAKLQRFLPLGRRVRGRRPGPVVRRGPGQAFRLRDQAPSACTTHLHPVFSCVREMRLQRGGSCHLLSS